MDTTKTRNGGSSRGESWAPDEILNQIRITRGQPGVSGHVHWNMKALMRNSSLDDSLTREVYTQPALAPAAPWLASSASGQPTLTQFERNGSTILTWSPADGRKPWLWVLQSQNAGGWRSEVLPGSRLSYAFTNESPQTISIRSVGRVGELSPPASITLQSSREYTRAASKPKSRPPRLDTPKHTD
jgi:hypothetical protein